MTQIRFLSGLFAGLILPLAAQAQTVPPPPPDETTQASFFLQMAPTLMSYLAPVAGLVAAIAVILVHLYSTTRLAKTWHGRAFSWSHFWLAPVVTGVLLYAGLVTAVFLIGMLNDQEFSSYVLTNLHVPTHVGLFLVGLLITLTPFLFRRLVPARA